MPLLEERLSITRKKDFKTIVISRNCQNKFNFEFASDPGSSSGMGLRLGVGLKPSLNLLACLNWVGTSVTGSPKLFCANISVGFSGISNLFCSSYYIDVLIYQTELLP